MSLWSLECICRSKTTYESFLSWPLGEMFIFSKVLQSVCEAVCLLRQLPTSPGRWAQCRRRPPVERRPAVCRTISTCCWDPAAQGAPIITVEIVALSLWLMPFEMSVWGKTSSIRKVFMTPVTKMSIYQCSLGSWENERQEPVEISQQGFL